ncbi:MAG: hypothetical protein ACRDCE_17935, partial [Cetobacterium sp.]|uniref:hypothetical protein n=1 Tax=Cetobacterium sp. TaxID=2071632 RepID=UPI003EE5A6C6
MKLIGTAKKGQKGYKQVLRLMKKCSCEFPSELHSVHTDRKHIRHCIWTENKNLKKGINDPSLASIYSQQ